MMNALPLDEKKRQLLEAKLQDHAAIVANGIITSPPAYQNEVPEADQAITQSQPNIIILDSNSAPGSRSNSHLSLKENNRTENSQRGRETPPKRSLELGNSDSFDGVKEERTTKAKRVERLDMDSPEPEKLANVAGKSSWRCGSVGWL